LPCYWCYHCMGCPVLQLSSSLRCCWQSYLQPCSCSIPQPARCPSRGEPRGHLHRRNHRLGRCCLQHFCSTSLVSSFFSHSMLFFHLFWVSNGLFVSALQTIPLQTTPPCKRFFGVVAFIFRFFFYAILKFGSFPFRFHSPSFSCDPSFNASSFYLSSFSNVVR